MSKKRRTVSLEPHVDELLDDDGVNVSALVNKLVKNHFTTGGDKRAMLELRAEQIEGDISELESQLESKREQLARVNEQLKEFQSDRNTVLSEASERLARTPLEPNNPAVKKWAKEASMSVEAFIEEMESRR